MTIKEFAEEVLCIPITRIGYLYMVEAIELVIDTGDYKFYPRLCDIHNTSTRYLETALRAVKNMSLEYMDSDTINQIFNTTSLSVSEYVIKAAEYYRRTYNED